MQKLIYIVLLISCFACSVQKRKYLKGYFVQRNSFHFQKVGQGAGSNEKWNVFNQPIKKTSLNRYTKLKLQHSFLHSHSLHQSSLIANSILPTDSCDILIFKDGTELQAKVLEVNDNEINYKSCNTSSISIAHVKKQKVFMIKYASGERQVIKEEIQSKMHEPKLDTNIALMKDSCDLLIFKDGTELKARVVEISETQLKYKSCEPGSVWIYLVKKSKIFMVKYASGERQIIKEETRLKVPQSPSLLLSNLNNKIQKNSDLQITHPKAIKAFVFGLLSFVFLSYISNPVGFLFFLLSIASAIIGTVAYVKATNEINKSPKLYKGLKLAKTGGIISITILSIILLFLLLVLVLATI